MSDEVEFIPARKAPTVNIADPTVNTRATQTPGIAVGTRLVLTPPQTPAVHVEQAPTRLVALEVPGVDVETRNTGTIAKPEDNPGIAVSPRGEGTPGKPVNAAGVGVAQAVNGSPRVPETPAVVVSTVNSGAAKPAQTPGIDVETRNSGTAKPAQTPGIEWQQVTINLTHRKGATVASEEAVAGLTDWGSITNAEGEPNGNNAIISGDTTARRAGLLRLNYQDFVDKTALTISSVKLRFYFQMAGTVANNGDCRLYYDIGAGDVLLEAFTGNINHINDTQGAREYDITTAIGGDWSKLNTLSSAVVFDRDVLETWTCAVNAVQVEVLASRTDTL